MSTSILPRFLVAGGLLLPTAALPPADVKFVLPAAAKWKDVDPARFDTRWLLPEARKPDLVADMDALLAVEFEAWKPAPGRGPYRTTGDLIAAGRAFATDTRGLRDLMEGFRRARPKAHREVRAVLDQVLRESVLTGDGWDPDEDSSGDGIHVGAPFTLRDRHGAPWRDLTGSRDVHQAAAVLWADLDVIKEVENDYSAYPKNVGASYEYIHAIGPSYVYGTDAERGPFSTLRLDFRCDLPFPYTSYDCDLRILNRVDPAGRLVTDIYSTSPDFHWMAGRDVFLPIRRSDGTWVATLLVRLFGFDIRSVPDGDDARLAALRSSLGNLKRRADAAYSKRRSGPGTVEGDVPRFRLRGVKPPADDRR